VVYVCPTYTSQRCSSCGWVRKSNRDADLNAAKNIALNLRPIGTKERLSHKNRKGFYLCEVVQEPIVPVAQKT
jgi:transposase